MPRHYIRKTNRGFTAEFIKAAADEVIIENKSVRSTAKKYDLCHVSLSRYVAKFKASMNNGDVSTLNVGYKGPKQVFSVDQEQILSQYIKNSAEKKFKAKAVKRNIFESKQKQKVKTTKRKKAKMTKENNYTSDEDETFCLVCMETFSSSKPNEQWIECSKCKFWTHVDCARECKSPFYRCDNCY
ncbi:uncharacterized protein LOC132923302 [Rhopalosiphum padi]|uniref:uncharacterized protein LOC132923302 n=1 Tax=Rhopalosiphum padi TaxID=40932 RepID=UPI00298E2365|nr:uncharacterized protein LOC132923302 [Rhopalosiphum padi]